MVGAGVHGDRAGAEARTSRFMTCLQPCETTRIKMAKPMICACVFLLLLRVGQSSLLQNGMIIGAKSVFGKFEGLNIASMAKTESYDVMRDGSIVHPWDGIPQANLATADEYDRQFDVTKKGVPLYFNNVSVHHANPYLKHKGYIIKPFSAKRRWSINY